MFAGSLLRTAMESQDKIVVVGGGPVGALAALYSAKRGYQVELHELRDGELHTPESYM